MSKQKLHYIQEEGYEYTYKFTERELAEFGQTMADACKEADKLELEKKAAVENFTDRIKSKRLEINDAARKYRNKQETRHERCFKYADYDTGEIVWKSKDTKEERGRRPMTAEELQMPLPLIPADEPKDNFVSH